MDGLGINFSLFFKITSYSKDFGIGWQFVFIYLLLLLLLFFFFYFSCFGYMVTTHFIGYKVTTPFFNSSLHHLLWLVARLLQQTRWPSPKVLVMLIPF